MLKWTGMESLWGWQSVRLAGVGMMAILVSFACSFAPGEEGEARGSNNCSPPACLPVWKGITTVNYPMFFALYSQWKELARLACIRISNLNNEQKNNNG